MAIWVCADLHLQHKNIINFPGRTFKTLEEHDSYVIDRFNSVVGKDDRVFILGDIGFTPRDKLAAKVRQLNGIKTLIVGNHDRLKDSDYTNMGIAQVIRHPVFYNANIVLSHIPVVECLNSPYVINIHGHLHGSVLDLPNFFNVNIELNDFLPINIIVFEEKAKQMCKQQRWEPFGTEWYANYYKKVAENE